jgi:DNA-binding XRE family transcriptional regulator
MTYYICRYEVSLLKSNKKIFIQNSTSVIEYYSKGGMIMSYKIKFSFATYHARKRMKITQEQAAEYLGISKRWYQIIEKGEALPSSNLVLKIIALFEIDYKDLR